MRYGGFPIAMFTLTPMYSAITPRENRIAPVPSRTTTMVDAHPSGTESPKIRAKRMKTARARR